VDAAESELEKQEVKLGRGKKLKKEASVETGKEESMEQNDTSVSEALRKVLETLPADTKAFL
jgi:hypothetical protein